MATVATSNQKILMALKLTKKDKEIIKFQTMKWHISEVVTKIAKIDTLETGLLKNVDGCFSHRANKTKYNATNAVKTSQILKWLYKKIGVLKGEENIQLFLQLRDITKTKKIILRCFFEVHWLANF